METRTEIVGSVPNGTGGDTAHLGEVAMPSKRHGTTWHYPPELDGDLEGVDLPRDVIDETISCAWEYTRCIIPTYTNWSRYLYFVRIVMVGIGMCRQRWRRKGQGLAHKDTVAEFRGDLVDVSVTDDVLGYNVQSLIDGCFAGTPGHASMGREYRSYLLFTGDKASPVRRGEDLFRRYVDSLARSPADWFRLRDCDGLIRFTAAAALSCNDFDDVWFRDDEWAVLVEISAVLYDAVAFYKHRAEAETNSTFAYFPPDLRVDYFRRCRELLWSLDAAWARSRPHLCVVSFLRYFGGPIKMAMRRYRFVEEELTIGRPETDQVVEQTRNNVKLWNRVDAGNANAVAAARYEGVMEREERLLFHGQAELLRGDSGSSCGECLRKTSYGAQEVGRFGGVRLCETCQQRWREYADGAVARAVAAFPVLLGRHGGGGWRRRSHVDEDDLGRATKRRKQG